MANPRYRVLPYRQGSKGARALADALGGRVLKLEGSTFSPRAGDVIINWGNTEISNIHGHYFTYNSRDTIKNASNKLRFFQLMSQGGLSDVIPRYWTNSSEIPPDVFTNGGKVVCRTVLAGHSGDGIVIASSPDDLVHAPLYVEYVKKQDEYRVHVGMKEEPVPVLHPLDGAVDVVANPKIIAIQRKARRHDTPDDAVNWQVRNHQNGFVYTRNGFTAPEAVLSAARTALAASGLDFGAVDVIYNANQGRAYVLEVNTAPGLEGATIMNYRDFFLGLT
jgi:glutathione synthase/RimK-type ligase-like ATP-grasp enzyme